ncbi:MAG: sugar transferase [Actinomycetes bacterium]
MAGTISGLSTTGPLLDDRGRLAVIVGLMVLWPTMLWIKQTRDRTILGQGLEEYRRLLTASAWAIVLAAAVAFFFRVDSARSMFLLDAVLGLTFLLIGRWLVRRSMVRVMMRGIPLSKVFVAAREAHMDYLTTELAAGAGRFKIVGSLQQTPGKRTPADVVEQALACGADTIVVGASMSDSPQWTRELGWAMEHTDLHLLLSPNVVEVAGPRLQVTRVEGLTLVSVDMPKFTGANWVAKRTIDLVGSVLLLIILGIPMLIIGLTVRLTSPGPALFKQPRAGRDGKPFTCWKFRSMVKDADALRPALREGQEPGEATFKIEDDPRVTTIGRFIRRYSIDELPQLVNVLRADMSLVGPRPHSFDDVELYNEMATRRLTIRPGMTGLWQVSGRSDLDWERNVLLDLYYVENWSLGLDIAIFMKTLVAVARGQGAY